jgi:hypothetical protein
MNTNKILSALCHTLTLKNLSHVIYLYIFFFSYFQFIILEYE